MNNLHKEDPANKQSNEPPEAGSDIEKQDDQNDDELGRYSAKTVLQIIQEEQALRRIETDARMKEQELSASIKMKEIECAREESHQVIDAQITDRKDERTKKYSDKSETKKYMAFGGGIILIFTGIMSYLGFSDQAFKVLSHATAALLGLIGGYGFHARKHQSDSE